MPADFAEQPVDPSVFGLPSDDDGNRDDALLGQNLLSCTTHEPDLDAVGAASTRVVIAVGEESEGQLARRGGEAVAARSASRSRSSPATTPGSSAASTARRVRPDAFAARLREVLAG